MPARKKPRIPLAVLERAREVSASPASPVPPKSQAAKPRLPREKIVAALKKLHPMD